MTPLPEPTSKQIGETLDCIEAALSADEWLKLRGQLASILGSAARYRLKSTVEKTELLGVVRRNFETPGLSLPLALPDGQGKKLDLSGVENQVLEQLLRLLEQFEAEEGFFEVLLRWTESTMDVRLTYPLRPLFRLASGAGEEERIWACVREASLTRGCPETPAHAVAQACPDRTLEAIAFFRDLEVEFDSDGRIWMWPLRDMPTTEWGKLYELFCEAGGKRRLRLLQVVQDCSIDRVAPFLVRALETECPQLFKMVVSYLRSKPGTEALNEKTLAVAGRLQLDAEAKEGLAKIRVQNGLLRPSFQCELNLAELGAAADWRYLNIIGGLYGVTLLTPSKIVVQHLTGRRESVPLPQTPHSLVPALVSAHGEMVLTYPEDLTSVKRFPLYYFRPGMTALKSLGKLPRTEWPDGSIYLDGDRVCWSRLARVDHYHGWDWCSFYYQPAILWIRKLGFNFSPKDRGYRHRGKGLSVRVSEAVQQPSLREDGMRVWKLADSSHKIPEVYSPPGPTPVLAFGSVERRDMAMAFEVSASSRLTVSVWEFPT